MARAEVKCLDGNTITRSSEVWAENPAGAKEAAEDRGEVYVAPEEQDRIETEAAAAEMEKARIEDLRAKCEKRGLDFEAENRKYLEKQAKKQKRKK